MDLELRHALDEFRLSQKETAEALHETAVQLARLDERQQETTRKVEAIQIALTNNFVGVVEFGLLKKATEDHAAAWKLENQRVWIKLEELAKDRDNDRTWFIRTIIGGLVSMGFALVLTWLSLKTKL